MLAPLAPRWAPPALLAPTPAPRCAGATALPRRELLTKTLLSALAAVPLLASAADVTEWQDPRWDSLGLKGTAISLRSVEDAAAADTIGQMGIYNLLNT